MPCPAEDFIVVPDQVSLAVSLEPVQNVVESLLLVYRSDEISGLDEWVTRTAAALTAEEREMHELVMIGFHYAVLPHQSWPSFPAYLDHLAALDPAALRDKMLDTYARMPPCVDGECHGFVDNPLPYDREAVLSSVDAYLTFLRERFPPEIIDEALERKAYAHAIEPTRMQGCIVSHLRGMWDRYLSAEWERVQPMLEQAVAAFRELDMTSMSRIEAVRLVTGQDLDEPEWEQKLDRAQQVILCPSAHVGPYLGKLGLGKTLWVLFGARLPRGVQINAPDLSRAEILVRLNALADNNRLCVLRLLLEKGELRSQEIMDGLELSQSTVSRHLNQLHATGYISERRCNGAKCYRLNPERIQETLQSVEAFLLGR